MLGGCPSWIDSTPITTFLISLSISILARFFPTLVSPTTVQSLFAKESGPLLLLPLLTGFLSGTLLIMVGVISSTLSSPLFALLGSLVILGMHFLVSNRPSLLPLVACMSWVPSVPSSLLATELAFLSRWCAVCRVVSTAELPLFSLTTRRFMNTLTLCLMVDLDGRMNRLVKVLFCLHGLSMFRVTSKHLTLVMLVLLLSLTITGDKIFVSSCSVLALASLLLLLVLKMLRATFALLTLPLLLLLKGPGAKHSLLSQLT